MVEYVKHKFAKLVERILCYKKNLNSYRLVLDKTPLEKALNLFGSTKHSSSRKNQHRQEYSGLMSGVYSAGFLQLYTEDRPTQTEPHFIGSVDSCGRLSSLATKSECVVSDTVQMDN